MFMTPRESLALLVLLLEQESYLTYIQNSDKKDIYVYIHKPYFIYPSAWVATNYRPISFLNVGNKIYTTILKI